MSPMRAYRFQPAAGSEPGTGRTAIAGPVQSAVSCSCDLSSFPGGDRLDKTGLDELAECGFGDADVTADPDEPDTALLDQPSWEALSGAEHVGGLRDRQQPLRELLGSAGHAASSVAERSGGLLARR